MINPILHNTTVSNNNNLTLIKDSRRLSRRLNHKPTCKLHARLRRHPIRSSTQSRNSWNKWRGWTHAWTKFRTSSRRTSNRRPTKKKGKHVTFIDQLPSQATANPRNQGASSSQTQNINHIHIDEEAVETALASSSLRNGKDLPDPLPRHDWRKRNANYRRARQWFGGWGRTS